MKTSVKRKQTPKRSRRRTRKHTAYITLVLVLVAGIGIALSMTLFFNISEISVINETDTPNEEIIALSGIKKGDNLVRIDPAIAAEKVRANVVYAEDVTVERVFPSTVQITVKKAEPIANISQSYGYLLVSRSNRVLEELKEAPREGLIVVTGYNPAQGTIGMVLKSEDEKRDIVLAAERGGCRVDDGQLVLQDIFVIHGVELDSGRILAGIGCIDAVDVFRHHDDIGADLGGAHDGGGIGGEERVADAASEDDYAAVVEVMHGLVADIRLGELLHLDGCHDAALDAELLKAVLKGEGVEGGRDHSHVIGSGAVHLFALPAAPDIAAADDDADLDAELLYGDYLTADLGDDVVIEHVSASARQRLAGKFEQDSFVSGLIGGSFSCHDG